MFLYVGLFAGHKAKSKIRGKYTSVSYSAVGDVTDRQDLVLDDEEGDDVRSSDEESSDFFDTDSDSSGTYFLKCIYCVVKSFNGNICLFTFSTSEVLR